MKERFSIGSKYEYCPNGNYWRDISGIFDREIFLYCDCKKCAGQVYVLRARKFKLEEQKLKRIIEDIEVRDSLQKVREMITPTNMDKVAELQKEGE